MDLGTHLIVKTVPKFRCCTHISTIAWCFLCYMAFGACSMRPLLLDLKLYAQSCCNLTSSCRYIGPCPLIALKVIMINLNLNCILNWTRKQCSSRRTGVIWHIFGILKIILAAKVWRRWSLVNFLANNHLKYYIQHIKIGRASCRERV